MSCLFCRLAAGEIPATRVYEDADVLAFRDIRPQAPSHVLVIPRRHLPSLHELEDARLAVNDAGELLVADTGNRRIQTFLGDGTFQAEYPVYGWEEFYTEPYIATMGDAVYVTDSYAHRFSLYRDGKFVSSWGRTGSGPGHFNRPIGIAAAPPNIVYVADTMNYRIQKFVIPAQPGGVEKPGAQE